jgi:hypothetical protein
MTSSSGMPSRGWYIVAAVLFLLCAVGAPVLFVAFLLTTGGGQQFQVPGATTLEVTKPGTYVIWYDHSTFFEGRSYSFGEALPNGLRVRIRNRNTGAQILMARGLGASETSGSEKRSSVGEFEAPNPGAYEIEVTGSFEPRVFSVRRSLMARMFLGILGLIGLELLGWVGAPLIVIIVFLKRRKEATPA